MNNVHHLYTVTPEAIGYDALLGLQDNDADSHRKWLTYGAALNEMKARNPDDNNAFGAAVKAAKLDRWPERGSSKLEGPVHPAIRTAAMWAAALPPDELAVFEAQHPNTEVTAKSGFRGLHAAVNKPVKQKVNSDDDDTGDDNPEFEKALAAVKDALNAGMSINDLTRTYMVKNYGLKHTNADYALHRMRGELIGIEKGRDEGYNKGYAEGLSQGRSEACIPVGELSGTAQKKLEAYQRAVLKQMQRQFADLVAKEVDRVVLEDISPSWQDNINNARKIIDSHRGVMTKAEFNTIRACLHPDSRLSVSNEKLAEAFRILNSKEVPLIPGDAIFKAAPPLPTSLDEWLARRKKKR